VTPDRDTFVVFGDMLGFASLVESQPDTDEGRLWKIRQTWLAKRASEEEWDFNSPIWQSQDVAVSADGPSELERRFVIFHEVVNRHIEHWRMVGPLTATVFSDSFFVAMDDGAGILALCAQLVVPLILNGIPTRMGVARGAFCMHEWALRQAGASRVSTAQFLGKGVVHAYKTESSGLKGIRVGLHSSLVQSMPKVERVAMPLPKLEKTKHCNHELNYLANILHDEDVSQRYVQILASVKAMQDALKPGSKHATHYTRTRSALRRMNRVGKQT
jgi:hypothetical protein